MIEVYDDNYFMEKAIQEAEIALSEGELPVGSVVVMNQQIIGRGHNQTEKLQDFTAHAEMIAITSATASLGNKYLDQASIYVTLEPCAMCASACSWSRIQKVTYAASDSKKGFSNYKPHLLHSKTRVLSGIQKENSQSLLNQFFQSKRN